MAKKSSALGRLVSCIEIKTPDGEVMLVPISAEDNITSNKILASKMRRLIEDNMKSYSGKIMTPKELKELAEAARSVAEFSGEVYKQGEPLEDGKPTKNVTGSDNSGLPDEIKFDALISDQKTPSQ
jgi:hypothetical protein